MLLTLPDHATISPTTPFAVPGEPFSPTPISPLNPFSPLTLLGYKTHKMPTRDLENITD